MDAKDKEIAELRKANSELSAENDGLKSAQNNVASPCGFMDIWNKPLMNQVRELQSKGIHLDFESFNASERREYTLEEAQQIVKDAEANDGIAGYRSQFMLAPKQTTGAVASFQVFPSHVLTYAEDNKQKEALDTPTTYRTEQFSKNVGGVNCYLKPRKVAVNE